MDSFVAKQELKNWKFTLDQTCVREAGGWATEQIDDSNWLEVTAPSAWETYEHALRDYEGCGWFRTRFLWNATAQEHCVLRFDGAGGAAKIYVNGVFAGSNTDRYIPFSVDATPFVHTGENLVAVQVDNTFLGKDHLPGCTTVEWVLYGGLTHRIFVEKQSACHLESVCVRAEADGTATVTATVENRSDKHFSGVMTIELNDSAEVSVSCPSGEKVEVAVKTYCENITPWSPACPQLYDFTAQLRDSTEVLDSYSTRVGYRTVETRGTELYLNGKPIYFKGVNRYDEFDPYGMCPPEEEVRKEFLQMKQMGVNLIRTHFPQDDMYYRLADEIGIMYMIEVPLNWWYPKMDEEFSQFAVLAQEAVADLEATFRFFCNHPCWTVWSVSNECTYQAPAAQQMFRMLAKRMRELDCRRLITCVIFQILRNETDLDFCDFISMNYYNGARANCVEELDEKFDVLEQKLKLAEKLYPNKPHVLTEFGVCAVRGFTGSPTEGRFSEDFAATYLQELLKRQDRYDSLIRGKIIWCWADYRHYRGFVMDGLGLQAVYGPWGLVTIDRKPKPKLIAALKEHFAEKGEG